MKVSLVLSLAYGLTHFLIVRFKINTLTKRIHIRTHKTCIQIVTIDDFACVRACVCILYVSQYGRFISCRTLNLLFIICCMNEWISPSLNDKTTWYLIDTRFDLYDGIFFLPDKKKSQIQKRNMYCMTVVAPGKNNKIF